MWGSIIIQSSFCSSSLSCCWPTDNSLAWSCCWRFGHQLCCISLLHDRQKLARPDKLVHHPNCIQALWLGQRVPGWDFIYDHESQLVMQHLIEKCPSLLLLLEICTVQFLWKYSAAPYIKKLITGKDGK